MSYKASAWAVEQRVGDPLAKLVLLTLAESADIDHQICWPSHSTIAKRIEASVDTVKRKLRLLQERGFITIERRLRQNQSWTSNRYRLHTEKWVGANSTQVGADSTGMGADSPTQNQSENQSGNRERTLSQKEGRLDGVFSLMNPNPKPNIPRLRPPTKTQLEAFYLSHPDCEWQIEAGIPDRLVKHRWKVKGAPVWNWKAMLLALDDPLCR